ncbi:MAG: ABC transporter ATP-binding protein/permease [Clostridia bacterium]|nr:ABC transporter ATP-binding protein/permease [Clostridia bacterium]
MSSLIKVLAYAKEYKNKLYLAVFLISSSVILGIIPYIMVYDIIVSFVEKNSVTLEYIFLMTGGIALCLFLKSFFYYKGLDASHEAAFDTLMGMRKKFAEKMTRLSLGDINDKGTGSYKKNFVDDIENIEAFIAHMLPEGIPYTIAPIVVFIALLILDWRLALLSTGPIPIGALSMILLMKMSIKKMGPYYQAVQKMNATIVEYISGMEVIKIFNKTTNSYGKYVSSVENYRKYTLDWFEESWTYMAVCAAVLPCTIILLLPIGTVFYVNGTLALSTFVLALLLAISLGTFLVKFINFFPILPQLIHKIEQLEKTFQGKELSLIDKGQDPENYNVEYKNVTFAYDNKDVIKNVSFYAKQNSVTAIVGESGSGKSTLAKLLVHFWDVKDGEITIGSVNINNMSFERLMNLTSYVSQDAFLFNTSVMDNIRIGRLNASDKEVISAAKLAMCHDFIMDMENGYETIAGDAGDKLSGGQKQRITIARAILKNAPIIILDEATAFTDSENEDKIQQALNQLIIGKTLIVIAHRLSTIVEADNIILMDKGSLIMQGSHDELLSKSKIYQSLWEAHIESTNWDINVKGAQHV